MADDNITIELVESETINVELIESEAINVELVENEAVNVELVENDSINFELFESEAINVELTAIGPQGPAGSSSGSVPTYKFIKALSQLPGDLHLSDATNWGISKALIKLIRIFTLSTDWDLYILQNDNGYFIDDANIPKIQIMEAGSGNLNIYVDLSYEDEDNQNYVNLYIVDNSGVNTFDIYIMGYELL